MLAKIMELRKARAKLIADANVIHTKAEDESRVMTAEEETEWSRLLDESDALNKRIQTMERQHDANGEMEGLDRRIGATNEPSEDGDSHVPNRRDILRRWAMGGNEEITPDERQLVRAGAEAVQGFRGNSVTLRLASTADLPEVVWDSQRMAWGYRDGWRERLEERAAQTVTTTGGGYVIPDEDMAALEDALLAFGGMRRAGATILRTASGASMPIPTVDDTGNAGSLLAINTGASETPFTFGQVTLDAFKYTSDLVLVPFELMQDSDFNFASFVTTRLATRIGRILNTHFTAGTGSGQPNGVKNVANAAVTTVASATAIAADELFDLQGALDDGYDANARWMFKKSTLTAIRKLKDQNDQYLFQTGLALREPDQLLGKPFVVNQDMRSIGADKRSVLYGDFSKYWIRDVMDITVLRLDERYAEKAQVGFVAFSRHDGDIIDAGTNPILAIRHPAS